MVNTQGLKIKSENIVIERIEADGTKFILGNLQVKGQQGTYIGEIQMFEKKESWVRLRVAARPEGHSSQILSPEYELAILPKEAPLEGFSSGILNKSIDPRTGEGILADEILICFNQSTTFKKATSIARKVKGILVGRFSEIGNCYQIKLPSKSNGLTVATAIKKLKAIPEVKVVGPNRLRHL